MTVKELIKRLETLDPDLQVFTEGKDRCEPAWKVSIHTNPTMTGHDKVCLIKDLRDDYE